jgi:hypothetical protein
MGLLDDAIREHMELKRLRGADPSEVARQEQDALGPVLLEEDAESQVPQDGIAEAEEISPDGEITAEDAARAEDDSSRSSQPAHQQDFANVGQETAELDMRTVLEEEHDAGGPESHPGPAPIAGEAGDAGAPIKDVLEETPEFLHDTPEQERLWLEQQSPRDFDFDK